MFKEGQTYYHQWLKRSPVWLFL